MRRVSSRRWARKRGPVLEPHFVDVGRPGLPLPGPIRAVILAGGLLEGLDEAGIVLEHRAVAIIQKGVMVPCLPARRATDAGQGLGHPAHSRATAAVGLARVLSRSPLRGRNMLVGAPVVAARAGLRRWRQEDYEMSKGRVGSDPDAFWRSIRIHDHLNNVSRFRGARYRRRERPPWRSVLEAWRSPWNVTEGYRRVQKSCKAIYPAGD